MANVIELRPKYRWAVIENAGMERGERVVSEFECSIDAWRFVERNYPEPEQEHIDVAFWDKDGEFWSYDY